MSFKDSVLDDIQTVFLDLDDFAEVISFDGQRVKAIIDDSHSSVKLGSGNGLFDASGLGLMMERRVLYMEDVVNPRPVPEQRVTVNNELWQVRPEETSVREEMGVLVVELQRIYA